MLAESYPHNWACFSRRLLSSNSFAISAALADECALLSDILVVVFISDHNTPV